MITEFEQRLAEALGARLAPPFQGRVSSPPFPAATANPDLVVAVEECERVEPDFGARRPEIAPGAADPRRVVRLRCLVRVHVRPGTNAGRPQQLAAVDAALYQLDAPDMRDGSALTGAADPGFLIQMMEIVRGDSPAVPEAPEQPPFGITLQAEGWFWPAGTPGQAGVVIADIRVRGAQLPITISPAAPELRAAGGAVELEITIGGFGVMRQQGRETPLETLPFGRLALELEGPGGRPGEGTLSGGTAGEDGIHLVGVTGGAATVTYSPPAQAGFEELIIALEAEPGRAGIEIGRFGLLTR